jgi:hypothetical protein
MAKHTSSNELDGAEPVPPPITSPVPVQEKARARKAQSSAGAASVPTASTLAEAAPDYAALGLDGEKARQAESLRLESLELGRKSTAGVFEWGRIAAALHDLADDQGHFAKLAKGVLRLSRTGAENYERVHRNLGPYRERLVQVGMIASGLYDLATAEPGQVVEVLAAREAGRDLTGAQIKAMVGKDGAQAASADDGGPEGLKAAVAEKTVFASRLLLDTLYQMARSVHVALEPHHAGGQVAKGKAEAGLVHPARLAGGLTESLVFSAQVPGGLVPAGVIHVLPLAKNRWARLRQVLYQMGSAETWPKAEETGAWLADTVLPEFEWALGRARADKAKAVLDERVAAAEAERAKAEKERERAKAEQKKAREKAKREKAKADKRAVREARTAARGAAAMAPVTDATEPAAASEA